MNRFDFLRRGISSEHGVLEIGPYFSPIAPRAAGFKTTTLDLYETDELRKRAVADPHVPNDRLGEIEDVDLVGSACSLADLTKNRFGSDHRFDWILSSHNIEHIPNPIRFLQQCAAVLGPNGTLRLAVPDKRTCFDHFRMLTDISDLMEAFFEKRSQPTPYQLFREWSTDSFQSSDRKGWIPNRNSLALYRQWFAPGGNVPTAYVDTHCWTFTPDSFELLVHDLNGFGLVDLQIASVAESEFCDLEFYVDLVKPTAPVMLDERAYYDTRERLLKNCIRTAFGPRKGRRKRSVPQRIMSEVSRVVRRIHAVGNTAS